jgi:hypothetical protein
MSASQKTAKKASSKPMVKKTGKAAKVQKVDGLNLCAEHQNPCINSDDKGVCKSTTQPCCVPIIEQCTGCERTRAFPADETILYCKTYIRPDFAWHRKGCPMATHIAKKKKEEVKVNPLKASKKAKKVKV